MLEILYNDNHNALSFIHLVDKETLLIVDDDLKIYATISHNPFEPSDQDLIDAWEKATAQYYDIYCEEITSEWRIESKKQSDEDFKKWLEKERGSYERYNIYERAYNDYLSLCGTINGEGFDKSKELIKEYYNINVMERADDHDLYDVNFGTCCFTIKNENGKAFIDDNSVEIYEDADSLGCFNMKEIEIKRKEDGNIG